MPAKTSLQPYGTGVLAAAIRREAPHGPTEKLRPGVDKAAVAVAGPWPTPRKELDTADGG